MRMLPTWVATLAISGILAVPAWAKDAPAEPKKAEAVETKKAKPEKKVLTAEEKKALQEKRAEQAKARLTKQFASLDANGDNAVSLEEFSAKKFAALDTNGDKSLSLEEFSTPPKKAKGGKAVKGKKQAGEKKKG